MLVCALLAQGSALDVLNAFGVPNNDVHVNPAGVNPKLRGTPAKTREGRFIDLKAFRDDVGAPAKPAKPAAALALGSHMQLEDRVEALRLYRVKWLDEKDRMKKWKKRVVAPSLLQNSLWDSPKHVEYDKQFTGL